MPEKQNEEWKETWRDEYLKWICGFANAQGGRIYIGVNDQGKVVGLTGYARLMEDIPNKIQQTLGIIAEVNLNERDGLPYIEINVAPSSSPINYKGEYHYRSGSTKQQLKGAALNDFLLRRTGARWDSVPVDNLTVDELDYESFRIFRENAVRSKRMDEEDAGISRKELLESLQLYSGGKLTRAAALLFYRRPEKFCQGCFVKIGKFVDGCELEYQDVLTGSLLYIADKALDILYLKYLKATISYEKDTRVERYPYSRLALRETIFNALIHCNWSDNIPIQIRVDEDALYVSNSCILPLGWTQETLTQHHRSQPFNPLIANTFFRAGFVESWGRGIHRVIKDCRDNGYPVPEYHCIGHEISVKFTACYNRAPAKTTLKSDMTSARELTLEERIVTELRRNPALSISKLSELLSESRSCIYRSIENLKKSSIICRHGTPKQGYWIISEK